MKLLSGLLNTVIPSRKKKVKIVKERRNNAFRQFTNEGGPSPSDRVVQLPNFRYFMEVYDDDKSIFENYKGNASLERNNIIWRNPEADKFKPQFLADYKSKKEAGTVFSSPDLAKDIVMDNEFFRYHARDFKIVLDYVNVNKKEEIKELTEDMFVPPPLGYNPDHIEKGTEEHENLTSNLLESEDKTIK